MPRRWQEMITAFNAVCLIICGSNDMNKLSNKKEVLTFVKERFPALDKMEELEPVSIILPDCFFEAGCEDASLSDKANFYYGASKFSDLFLELVKAFHEPYVLAGDFRQNGSMYETWSDLKNHYAFVKLKTYFQDGKFYQLTFPEDDFMADLLVENGFCYFTNLDLFFPRSRLMLRFDCHMQILIWPDDHHAFQHPIQTFMKEHPEFELVDC